MTTRPTNISIGDLLSAYAHDLREAEHNRERALERLSRCPDASAAANYEAALQYAATAYKRYHRSRAQVR